jgi:hypothetical protein
MIDDYFGFLKKIAKKNPLGLNLESGEEYLLYLGAVKSWLEALSHIGNNYSISEEVFPDYPWWEEFNIQVTSFEEGVKK